ncbi:MAG: RNA polymerase factor sigma-54 [Candidatus Omnitrophica bacterium]|nr:RNA polymerase factor sigma-54 [Candidatus Omnitrophota bacterium]MBU4589599.1 RNA polymerase factor sigma-54 [Candidatus Omnitrophota bacterium]
MQLELKPANKLTYKLRLTPQMRLDISLLQMPMVKLQEYVKQQVEENPLLEIDPHTNWDIPDVKSTIGVGVNEDEEAKQNYRESLITKSATLSDHLLNQLHLFASSDEERKIGEVIIANIDDNGYLMSSIEKIAESAQAVPSQVQKVLSLVQTFDPVGVGARDLRECLLLQINPVRNTTQMDANTIVSNGVKAKGQENSLAGQVIDKYLHYLEKKRFEFIAKKLKVPVERIKEAIKEIANLEPKPGRSFNTERAVRLIPDAILERNNDKYEVMLNDWELPSLNLNPKYKRMLNQKGITEDTKKYLKERLEAAKFLINAINKRKETIQKVTEAIVYIQKDFLDGMYTPTPIELKKNTATTIGVGASLKPMTLSQIAKLVSKHKSTVSRTVSNKYLQTPDGIFELRHFLNSGIKQENGEFYSSKAIKSKIKELIENEDKKNPLTDQEIVNLLKQDGISVSRRVIAKYRHQLKILPSQSRQE